MTVNRKNIIFAVIVLFVAMLLIDRLYWAQISQWREDQATNIWLGYTAGFTNIPIGLMSSKGIPNPNGMVLLGFLLSALPNLLTVSFFLGVIQIVLLILVGWGSFGSNRQYFILATLPLLSSVVLRSISVELWNQYTITLINIFFLYWIINYLKGQSLWNLPPLLAMTLLAPSLYLAGIVNTIVMVILTVGTFLYKRPKPTKDTPYILIICLAVFTLSLFSTWIPYFQNVDLEKIAGYNKFALGPVAMFQTAWKALFSFPVYATFQWADRGFMATAFKHADSGILSHSTNLLLRVTGRLYLTQAIFAFLVLTYSIIIAFLKKDYKVNFPVARIVVISGLFISTSYMLSSFLSGPIWIDGERPDQAVQFLPMFLLVVFLLPHIVTTNGKIQQIIKWFSHINLILFCVVNFLCGFLIIRDHLLYRGNILTEADVPLTEKMQVVDFIAKDWMAHSTVKNIPVDYDLGGGRWDDVSEFGSTLLAWYPAPMTMGRSFDYELLREYGLKNQQEGIQLRTFGSGRYLITYAFEEPPVVKNGKITNYIFGRLRVSIVER